jgi:hypothetical protein
MFLCVCNRVQKYHIYPKMKWPPLHILQFSWKYQYRTCLTKWASIRWPQFLVDKLGRYSYLVFRKIQYAH